MIRVWFRVPRPEDINFGAWLPAIPREGETVETADGIYTVKQVVWYTEENESPYLILE